MTYEEKLFRWAKEIMRHVTALGFMDPAGIIKLAAAFQQALDDHLREQPGLPVPTCRFCGAKGGDHDLGMVADDAGQLIYFCDTCGPHARKR